MPKATRSSSPSAEVGPVGLVPFMEAQDGEEWGAEGDECLAVAAPPAVETRQAVVTTAQQGQRLDAWLVGLAGEFSRSHLKSLVESGCVLVGGQVVDSASRKVQAGQLISVTLRPTAQSQAFVAEPMTLPIVFEDQHLMVINKPAGLVVHPAAGNWTGTLMNGLLAHHSGAAALPRAGIVHRLDKDTSGLMVVGKTLQAVTALSRAIADRVVKRQYVALVHGLAADAFTVEAPIARDPVSRVRMAVVASGKPARTDVRCLMRATLLDEQAMSSTSVPRSFSAVECTLHTGRTHQIRVHLASQRHPLVADALYGGQLALGMGRQALHAFRLAFAHPINGAPLTFEAALPSDMAAAWQQLQSAAESASTGA